MNTKRRNLQRLWVATLAMIFAGQVFAQLSPWPNPITPIPISLTPPVPQLGVTPGGVQGVNYSGTLAVTITWFQPVLVATQQPRDATHFAVCLQAPGVTCTWPAMATTGVFAGAATGSIFTRTAVYTPASPFIQNPIRLLAGYNYSTTVTLNNAVYDRQMKWSVASCASAAASSCTYAVGNSIWYTSKELVADVSIDYEGVSGSAIAIAEGVNLGTSAAHGFSSRVTAYPALIGASGACALDPNEANLGVVNGTRAFTADGQWRTAGSLWDGTRYNTANLSIIGLTYGTMSYSATAMTTANNSLPPETDPERKTDLVSRTASSIPSNSSTRYGLVAVGRVDELGQITETNEGDNARAECKSFAF